MRRTDNAYFEHPLVVQMFQNNKHFYESIYEQKYPIERLVNRPNRQKEDVVKILAFGILGNKHQVIYLLYKYHFGWRKAFKVKNIVTPLQV